MRAFVDEVIAPAAAAMARGDGPRPDELVRVAGSYRLAGLLVPPEYGGAGATHGEFTRFVEAVARHCASSSVILDVHLSVGTEPILAFGTREQQQRFLPRLASGECTSAFALTEPGSGSDAAGMTTRAERDGDGYRITGTKAFITNSGAAGVYVVMARTGPGARGISAFVVEAGTAGLRCGPPLHKMGLRGSWTAEVILDGARVPASNRLGDEGDGFGVAMATLDRGRVGISAQAVGIAHGCVDAIVETALARGTVDETALADVCARTEAARLLTAHAAALADAGLPATREAAIAKLFATDTVVAAAHAAVELCAPESAYESHPASVRLRDAKACQIYEGTNQVQRIVIARGVLRT
jgi:alkylation response protein AidB-like acyl-CoA dehydrogenase